MLIFFDTEFSDLGIDPRLVSIGLISEDGREFYAELSDTYVPKDCSPFTQEGVLPLLQGGDALMTMDKLTLRLGSWLESFEQPIKLSTDSLSWDWPWIQELFYLPGTWPANLDGKPALLHELIESPFSEQLVEHVFENHVPKLRRHHALDDAKANRLAWFAWKQSKLQEFSLKKIPYRLLMKALRLDTDEELIRMMSNAGLPMPRTGEE
jgi:hypothetical protein